MKNQLRNAFNDNIGRQMFCRTFASFRSNHFISFFQNLQKKAESLIEKYEFDYTKALKDVDYVNVNNVTGKGGVTGCSTVKYSES